MLGNIHFADMGSAQNHLVWVQSSHSRLPSCHPGYHVNPMRLNGSAVETIFSKLKYITSGQLTAVTYETAKASLLTKQAVHGTRTRDDYRDTELYIRESELQCKSKSSKAHNTTNN